MLFTRSHLDQREMTSLEEMSACLWELIVQMLPFSSTLSIHIHLASLLSFPAGLGGSDSSSWRILSVKLWLHCLVPASHHSTCEIDNDGSPLDVAPKNLLSSPFIHTCIQIEKFRDTQRQTNRITHPSSLPHSRTHLPFHPKETVRIQTNRGDGYCPNAIILYCPSRWLLWDKGPSVDEDSSVWMGG